MEIVAFAFPTSFRKKLYPKLVSLQDLMGIVNDHATAVQIYLDWLKKEQDQEKRAFLEGLLVAESKAHQDVRHTFVSTWTPEAMSALRLEFEVQPALCRESRKQKRRKRKRNK